MNPSYDRDWFPPAIERFVNAVEAGQVLKTTEFAGATPVVVSNLFREAGDCRYDSGAVVADGAKVILLFHCKSAAKEQGVSVFMNWDGNNIQALDALANEIVAGGKD